MARHFGSGASKRQLILSPKWTELPIGKYGIETGGVDVAGFSCVDLNAKATANDE